MTSESRLGFLSKSTRQLPNFNESAGEYYEPETTHHEFKPNFAPFCTTSKREMILPTSATTPSPGEYNVVQDITKSRAPVGSIFKSKTRRFVPDKPAAGPGPGTYVLQPAIKVNKPMRRARSQPSTKFESLQLTAQPSAPSIPTKFQSFGYEETEDGLLHPQQPLKPGFSGLKNDGVGPGDYDPKLVDSRHPRAASSLFHKGAPRMVGEKAPENPGPGHYNFRPSFEPMDDGSASNGNFYMKLSNVNKRQMSSFESTTQRSSLIGRKIDPNEPGPQTYNVPRNGVEVKKRDVKIQCFDSTVDRFRDPMPRSQRIKTHPGSYNPITSDFERNRLKILRRKRMLGRSGWAQNVSFQSTEERFFTAEPGNVAPPPGTYVPKTAIADHIARQNPRSGAFGSSVKRFYTPKSQTKVLSASSDDAEAAFSAYQNADNRTGGQGEIVAQHTKPKSVKPSRMFASSENRFAGKKDITNAPPPGTYNTTPSWKVPGVLKMKDHTAQSLPRKESQMPGPGDYNVSVPLVKKHKNPKALMGGSADRFHELAKDVNPGPGHYDPIPPVGTLQVPTYNAVMADEAALRSY